jgi:hypothetical protein
MDLTDCPPKVRALPRDSAGHPVPFFVAWVDGKPDFRVVEPERLKACVQRKLCWVCGKLLLGSGAFVIGPMCVVNRNTAEPPCHRACASWSARNCPFLVTPGKERREAYLPDGHAPPAGLMIVRNPGVACVYVSATWGWYAHEGGVLFDLGQPLDVEWWREGRPATREEVAMSIETGLPALMEVAEEDGPAAKEALVQYVGRALALLPLA